MSDPKANAEHLEKTDTDEGIKNDIEHHVTLTGEDVPKPGYQTLDEVLANDKPRMTGQGMLKLYALFAIIYLGATMSGFDGSLISSINALTEFQDYYDMGGAAAGTGLMFSIFNVGQLVGAFFIVISDIWGRKIGVATGCVGVIASTAVMATATTIAQFNASRFLIAFFTTIASASCPLLAIELAPPHIRGRMAGLYNTLFYLGAILAGFSILGVRIHHAGSIITFKLPLWLQVACPAILLAGLFFIPESPRWLVACDRHEKAREILVKYHANGQQDHPLVDMEMAEITDSLQKVGLNNFKTLLDWRGFLVKRSDRYRLMLNVLLSWFAQYSGNNVSSYYLPKMLGSVGISDPNTQILLNALYNLTGWIAAASGAFLHDRVGRRKVFISSTISMSISLAMVAVTTSQFEATGSMAASKACIAFIFIFGCCFAVGFTSMQPIYPGEVSSNKLRAKSMIVHQGVGSIASFLNQFTAPIAMENIGFWFYVFYSLWDLVEAATIYFLFVETKGRTLEELDIIFEAKNPRKASLKPPSRTKTTEDVV